MEKPSQTIPDEITRLAEDARALIAATAEVAGDEVTLARQRLAAALEQGKAMFGQMKHRAAECTKAADVAVHERPYQAIAIGVGLGALLGFWIARKTTCDRA